MTISMEELKDPLYIEWYTDESGNKVNILRTLQSFVVTNNYIVLPEIPDELNKVSITGYTEIPWGQSITSASQYSVCYYNGIIAFDSSKEGSTIEIASYYARGMIAYPASRIWVKVGEGGIELTLGDLITRIQNFEHKGTYSASVTYYAYNMVSYSNATYLCTTTETTGIINETPSAGSSHWTLLGITSV